MKTDYGVARNVCTLVETIGWLIVLVGGGVAVMSFLNKGAFGTSIFYGLISGGSIAVTGFFMIMGAQVTRANVDNADYTREIMAEIKELKVELNPKNTEDIITFD